MVYTDSMKNSTVSIYDAKTQLSKLVKQASSGKTIYIGAYGHPQAMLVPLPTRKTLKLGLLAHKAKPNAYDYDNLVSSDQEIVAEFEKSISKRLP